MRYVFGSLALLAAVIIVGYSATTLFAAAFNASAEPWQQYLNGTGAAAIVIWEATALILIGAAWHRGYKPVAVLSALLLVVAMVVTLTWEMGNVIGGQADKLAARAIDTKKQEDIEKDLKWLRDRRDQLTNKTSSKAVRDEMEWISNRIGGLETDRSNAKAVGEASPRAAWAARMFGGTEQLWADILNALPLLFWMLARVTAAPLAVAALVGVKPAVELRTREEKSPATLVLKETLPPVQAPPVQPLALSNATLDRIVKEIPAPSLALKELFPEDPDGPKGGGKKLILPSSEVGQPAKEAPAQEMQKTATAAFFDESDSNVVDLLSPKQRRDLAHGSRKKKGHQRTEGNVVDWLAACTSQTPDKRVKATSQDCRKSYMAWCSINRLQPVGHKQMSRIISVEIYRGNDGARGPRNGKGAVFPGLLVSQPIAEQLRKRA